MFVRSRLPLTCSIKPCSCVITRKLCGCDDTHQDIFLSWGCKEWSSPCLSDPMYDRCFSMPIDRGLECNAESLPRFEASLFLLWQWLTAQLCRAEPSRPLQVFLMQVTMVVPHRLFSGLPRLRICAMYETKQKNLQLLDILACNSANKLPFKKSDSDFLYINIVR